MKRVYINDSQELKINSSIITELFDHALKEKPIESCGYLAGKDHSITAWFPMVNIDNKPDHFTFDPKEQFKVLKEARSQGLKLLGVYHSHPETPARLSEEDIKLFNDPNMIYVIVSLQDEKPIIKAFRLKKSVDEVIINELNIVKEVQNV